jgi:hypothetical protein
MDRRNLLKILPLVTMAGTVMKIGETEAIAYKTETDKKYIIVLPNHVFLNEEKARRIREMLAQRGINASLIEGAENLKIYELQ